MFNMANLAKKTVEKEVPEMSIEVIDSMTSSVSEGLLALQTAKLAATNQDIQSETHFALAARQKTGVVFAMETLRHVYRTGRIPKVAARIGSLLPIKPIITITEGQAHISAVSRTMKNGLRRMIEILKSRVNNSPVMLVIQHAQIPESARVLLRTV
jgi:DegV family protein with EDD domain